MCGIIISDKLIIYQMLTHEEYLYYIQAPKENMTEQGNFPIINAGGEGMGGMGGLMGMLPLLLLAPLLGRGFGRDGEGGGRNLEAVIAEQVGDLRHDLGESTVSNLKETFQAEKDAIIAGFQARLEGQKEIAILSNKIDEEGEETNGAIACLKNDMDDKFCGMKEMMLAGFAKIAERELCAENATLKAKIACLETANNTNAIINAIRNPATAVPVNCGCGN